MIIEHWNPFCKEYLINQLLGVIAKNAGNDSKMKMHFSLLIGFLIVAHIAMIFGMLNPAII